jgi:hypothetical protein
MIGTLFRVKISRAARDTFTHFVEIIFYILFVILEQLLAYLGKLSKILDHLMFIQTSLDDITNLTAVLCFLLNKSFSNLSKIMYKLMLMIFK